MKQFYILFFLIFSFHGFGQTIIPPAELESYYNNIDFSPSNNELFDDLAVTIIGTHTNFLSYPERHNYLYDADTTPSDGDNVTLIYSGEIRPDNQWLSGSNPDNPQTYNTEHVYPRSLLGSGTAEADLHLLRVCDISVNSERGNKPFIAGSGNYSSTGSGFFPGDDWRGDVARIILYTHLRYNEPFNDVGSLNLFLEWNALDPVTDDGIEDNRNLVISGIQGNRNPFVDNPFIATLIWGGPSAQNRWNTVADTEAPTAPTNLVASNATTTTIDLSWNASTDNVSVTAYDIHIDGTFAESTSSTNITITGLSANTEFCFTVFAKDAFDNTSTSSNQACEITLENSSGGSGNIDLFISEYVEGSSFNKALEIANFTGNSVNLSGYSLARDTNSNGAWTGAVNLSGSLNSGDVFVVAHDNANSQIQAVTDQAVGDGFALDFNGNDPVGLFKNGVLIDVFGTFGGSNEFDNITYRRKETVDRPTSVFDLSQWEAFPEDNVDDLGNHTQSLSIEDFSLSNLGLFPNPVKDVFSIQLRNSIETKVELYNVLGAKVLQKSFKKTINIDINQLNAGIYLLRLQQNDKSITKRLVKN